MWRRAHLPSNFDSLPESRIDPSESEEDSDAGHRLTAGRISTDGSSERNRRPLEGGSGLRDETRPGGTVSPPCRCYAGARNLPPEVDDYHEGEKIKGEKSSRENGRLGSSSVLQPLEARRSRELTSSPNAVAASADVRENPGKDEAGVQSNVLRPMSRTRVGFEEDYENDENCIITEDDLGDITSDVQQLNSPSCPSAERRQRDSGQGGRRKAFYKQMLCSEPAQSRLAGQDLASQQLDIPSQVLKLIHRFQTRINNNGEDSSLSEDTTPMEVSSASPPEVKLTIKQPPRVFPKKPPRTTSLVQEPVPRNDNVNDSQEQPQKPDKKVQELLFDLTNELASMVIEPPPDYGSCDQEALEAIEQLDKSIEEVVLSDEDFARTISTGSPPGTGQEPQSEKEEEDQVLPSEEDVSGQTLTVDTEEPEKPAASPILTDEGFADGGFNDNSNKKDLAEERGSAAPRMTDAAVNTDFEAAEEEPENGVVSGPKDVEEREFASDRKAREFKRLEYFEPNVVDLAAPKLFRDKEIAAEVKPQLSGKKQWQMGYPVLNAGPSLWSKQTPMTNGHNDRGRVEEEGISESDDSFAEKTLKDTEASHRMSTATLDGAVVASAEDNAAAAFSSAAAGHHGHFVVVAIDFGTTFSGYAFSFVRDTDNIHIMRKWEGGDPGVINQKTLTTVLLTPDKKFHSVGFTARDRYHDLDADEAKRWLYFDKFKMALHHNLNLSEGTEIRANNGTAMPAVVIFAHVLRFYREHALQELSDQSATRILDEDVRWVITVPAIWRQPAKQFMRQAAYQSGIASPNCPDQLLIALEPEAASIYCRKLKIHQLVSESPQLRPVVRRPSEDPPKSGAKLAVDELRPGTRYMVVDCGGGTVDITVHEMADDEGNLKELHKPNGGPCGSVMVDAEFESLLNDIFGADFMVQFKKHRPAAFVDLMMAFEARKRNVTFRNNPSNISLPFSFVDYYKKCKGVSVEAAIKKFGRRDVRWSSQGMLRLEPSAMRQLFSRVVRDIKSHVAQVLRATDHTVQYLFLVGGFAESQILQREIRDGFERLKIIIPQEVGLAVLKGAVLYGREPTVISVRRSRMTYGVGVLNRFVPRVHPGSKRVVRDGTEWCADVFDRFVTADESVGLGDVVLRSYTPATRGQTNIVLHVYSSESDDVFFITDEGVCRCGTLHLDLSDVRYVAVPGRREIQARMAFGDTELKVSALDVTTGKCVRARLDFLNQ